MPLLTMLYTRKGTEDGISVKEYKQGNTYMLGSSLYKAFLAAGYAVEAIKKDARKDNIISFPALNNINSRRRRTIRTKVEYKKNHNIN